MSEPDTATTTSVGSNSARPYVDHPVADLRAAERLATRAAHTWGLPAPALLRRGMNAIYAAGPTVIRVGEPTGPADAGPALARHLLERGLPVAEPARDTIVHDGVRVATCWQRVDPTDEEIDWAEVGALVREVHRIDAAELPADYPLPSAASFPWWDFDALLASTEAAIDPPALDGIRRAVERHRSWNDFSSTVVCHGDIHPGNILMSADGAVLIDWDLLCLAPPAWDHAPMMTWAQRWGGPAGDYERFADGYGVSMADDPTATALAELRLVAATLMRVRAGMANPSAGNEARRRLRYWREDPAAPQWCAQ